METSRLPGFGKRSRSERTAALAAMLQIAEEDFAHLLQADPGLLDEVEMQSENVIGFLGLPFSVATNFRIDGRDCLIPMAIEEATVVAAASNGARLFREGDGIKTVIAPPLSTGQIQVVGLDDEQARDAAGRAVLAAGDELLELANKRHPNLELAGGGLTDIRYTTVDDDLLILLDVNVAEAMGANIVNDICEALAPSIEQLTGGTVVLRIITNYCDRRLAGAEASCAVAELARSGLAGERIARRIERASRLAERDVYRAVTHNKGIMNGVDAVLLATGQDFRAVEAAAAAYAARGGSYSALSTWRVEGERLVGRFTLPLAVGAVGGAIKARTSCRLAFRMLGLDPENVSKASISVLSSAIVACGLVQNFAALWALAAEGITTGQDMLRARNRAAALGASAEETESAIVALRQAGKRITADEIERILSKE